MSNQKTYAQQIAREDRDASRRLPEHMQPSDPAERMARYDNEGKIMPKHTPGPWEIWPHVIDSQLLIGRLEPHSNLVRVVCEVDGEDVSDAHLIAAAPDLLRAAINALADLDNLTSGEYAAGADQASRDELRTAIARTRGEE